MNRGDEAYIEKSKEGGKCVIGNYRRESSRVNTLKHAATICDSVSKDHCTSEWRGHTSSCNSRSFDLLTSSLIACAKFAPIP